jgi:hypothetical protein
MVVATSCGAFARSFASAPRVCSAFQQRRPRPPAFLNTLSVSFGITVSLPPLPLSTPRPTSTHPDADHSPFHTPRCVPMWLRALRSRQHNGALSPRATLHPRFTPDEATEPAEAYRLIRADDAFCRYIRRLTDARATILVQRLGSMMAARYLPSSARHGGMLDQKETSGGP